jgi:hypothetical protein
LCVICKLCFRGFRIFMIAFTEFSTKQEFALWQT